MFFQFEYSIVSLIIIYFGRLCSHYLLIFIAENFVTHLKSVCLQRTSYRLKKLIQTFPIRLWLHYLKRALRLSNITFCDASVYNNFNSQRNINKIMQEFPGTWNPYMWELSSERRENLFVRMRKLLSTCIYVFMCSFQHVNRRALSCIMQLLTGNGFKITSKLRRRLT